MVSVGRILQSGRRIKSGIECEFSSEQISRVKKVRLDDPQVGFGTVIQIAAWGGNRGVLRAYEIASLEYSKAAVPELPECAWDT